VTQQTLVLLKPDAVARGLVGEILRRFEMRGLRIVAMDLRTVSEEHADEHYAEHTAKDWYPGLRAFITGGPLVALVLAGNEAVSVVRLMIGATNAVTADPGTVRGDLSLSGSQNLVHASDGAESAAREIALWFPDL
jgi:nucleoside-diphosphate kinase